MTNKPKITWQVGDNEPHEIPENAHVKFYSGGGGGPTELWIDTDEHDVCYTEPSPRRVFESPLEANVRKMIGRIQALEKQDSESTDAQLRMAIYDERKLSQNLREKINSLEKMIEDVTEEKDHAVKSLLTRDQWYAEGQQKIRALLEEKEELTKRIKRKDELFRDLKSFMADGSSYD